MKSLAIITEYNPFHNGHKYQLSKARMKFQPDVIVVLMSGNFVQRGEPALLDKKVRAELALNNGADLVIELPWFGSVQSADYFAEVGVNLLSSLNIDELCFGTDYDEQFSYEEFVKKEQEKSVEIEKQMQIISKEHASWSYPRRLAESYKFVFDENLGLSLPNHVLGLSYARANLQIPNPMKLQVIKRIGANHYDGVKDDFASGSAIRNNLLQDNLERVKNAIPKSTYQALKEEDLHYWDDYYKLLKTQVITKTSAELSSIYQMTEGLEYKVKQTILNSATFLEWIDSMKTSRYTVSRIQRLATYLLLNITTQNMKQSMSNPYLKILGCNSIGRQFLKSTNKTLPIVSNIRQQDRQALCLEQWVEEIYHLPEKNKFNFAKSYNPIIIK